MPPTPVRHSFPVRSFRADKAHTVYLAFPEWAAWYESTMYGASHWLGTSAMRPLADGGVVSPELKCISDLVKCGP